MRHCESLRLPHKHHDMHTHVCSQNKYNKLLKNKSRTCEMARRVKALAVKSDNLTSIPENWHGKCLLWPPHTGWGMDIHCLPSANNTWTKWKNVFNGLDSWLDPQGKPHYLNAGRLRVARSHPAKQCKPLLLGVFTMGKPIGNTLWGRMDYLVQKADTNLRWSQKSGHETATN